MKAKDALTNALGTTNGYWMTILGFFGGMLFIALIDKFIPKATNPHEVKLVEDVNAIKPQVNEEHLMKMGVLRLWRLAFIIFQRDRYIYVSY